MKICLIANYFGAPPAYFQLWLDSCAFNRKINWLFFTDISPAGFIVPENVFFKTTNFMSFKKILQSRVPYPIRYEKPWDFCALKPILGYLFEHDLEDCDFWGWSDCDLIFGDLAQCIEACHSSDKVMPKGHLSFIRNSRRINMFLANHQLTHKAIAADDVGLPCYDEVAVPEIVLPELGVEQNNTIPFVNAACRPGNFVLDDVFALQTIIGLKGNDSIPFVATWHDGKMIAHFASRSGEVVRVEIAYFHFFRRHMNPKVERLVEGKHYLIIPNEIREYDGHELPCEEILELDRFCIHWRYWRDRLKAVTRKLRSVI